MRQTNPHTVEVAFPTLGFGVGPGETFDHPVLLAGMVAAEPVSPCDICPTATGGDPLMCMAPHCRRDDFERRPPGGPAEVGARPDAKPAKKTAARRAPVAAE